MEDKITLHDILEVNEMDTEEMKSYYHKPTQAMVVISEEDLDMVKNNADISGVEDWKQEMIEQATDFLKNPEDYLEFPKEEEYNEENLIIEFIESIKDDNESYEKLSGAMKEEKTIRKFKDELFKIDLIDKWYDFREEKFLEIAKSWCERNNVEYI